MNKKSLVFLSYALLLAGGCTAPLLFSAGSTPSAGQGFLEGQVTIGPVAPAERLDQPRPTASPQLCAAWGLSVYDGAGQREIKSFTLEPDCTYRVALSPGNYVVRLKSGMFGASRDLPKNVTITNGETTRLDVTIDTGIR